MFQLGFREIFLCILCAWLFRCKVRTLVLWVSLVCKDCWGVKL